MWRMSAALKLNLETESLSEKPRLGKKITRPRLIWENPKLTGETQKGKLKAKPDSSYGRVLYNYFRYYDPSTGRYLTADPIGLLGGLNMYTYALNNPIVLYDPYGLWVPPSLPQGFVDFSAGLGDTLLLGFGDELRDLAGVDGGVNKCSKAYSAGEYAGIAGGFAAGGIAGLRAAGQKAAGKEFSHWIPNRLGGPRSIWNGNYVTTATHALSDPYRYRFMPRAWKAMNPMPSRLNQQLVRLPNVYKGTSAGGAYGATGASLSGCECSQ